MRTIKIVNCQLISSIKRDPFHSAPFDCKVLRKNTMEWNGEFENIPELYSIRTQQDTMRQFRGTSVVLSTEEKR